MSKSDLMPECPWCREAREGKGARKAGDDVMDFSESVPAPQPELDETTEINQETK